MKPDAGLDDPLLLLVAITMGLTLAHAREIMQVSLEQPARMLGFAVTSKQYGLPADYWDSYPAKIAALTADDVQRVARKYLNPDALQLVAVGDASKIKPALEKYGSVEVFDSNGAPLAAAETP